jgi:hypothetical protein
MAPPIHGLNGGDAVAGQRFTIDGSETLEQQLAGICAQVRAGVQAIVPARNLEALVLGGGYGRGQGGVLKTDSGDRPYNDLEFYVFVRGNQLWNQHRYRHALGALGERLSPEAGLHVEFKVDSFEKFRRRPVSMFSYDLVSGHRILLGQPGLFKKCAHHLVASAIPLAEATRLLFNRCTGLLLARERIRRAAECGMGNPHPDSLPSDGSGRSCSHQGPNGHGSANEEADFIARNLAKAQLALGDVILAAFNQYHWDCTERHRRLQHLAVAEPVPRLQALRAHHAMGVDFKLHPRLVDKPPRQFEPDLLAISMLTQELWLWLEHRRLGSCFTSARDYALARGVKCPENPPWRNYLLSLRTFGFKIALDGSACRYPRERLLNALPLLLWNGETFNDPALCQHLQGQLQTQASDWLGLVAAYKKVWADYG